jgi:hypothetical protein
VNTTDTVWKLYQKSLLGEERMKIACPELQMMIDRNLCKMPIKTTPIFQTSNWILTLMHFQLVTEYSTTVWLLTIKTFGWCVPHLGVPKYTISFVYTNVEHYILFTNKNKYVKQLAQFKHFFWKWVDENTSCYCGTLPNFRIYSISYQY